MSPAFKRYYWKSKRFLLKKLVPEIIWPVQVELDGVRFKVRNMPYSAGTKYILTTGKYELPERKLLVDCIRPGDQVVEMGGSIGVLTAIIAKLIGPTGKLVSIEASESLVAQSAPWLEKNANTKVVAGYAFPVDDCAEKIRVTGFDESAGALAGVVSFEQVPGSRTETAKPANQQKIFDLKTIASQFEITPNILVADIEGSERIILDDTASIMNSIQHILIELHPAKYGSLVKDEIISKIKRLGYEMTAIEENTCLFRKVKEIKN